ELHAPDVERLALDVDRAHVDLARQAEERARRRRRDPMLPGPGLGDDAALSHPLGQQHLTQRVVQLVRAGVAEVLTLEEDPGPARSFGETRGLIERRGTTDVVPQQPREAVLEVTGFPRLTPRLLEGLDGRHHGLRNEAPAISAVTPTRIRLTRPRHDTALLAASTKRRIRSASLIPAADSTPPATSTPAGLTARMAVATFSGVSPPATNTLRRAASACACSQTKGTPF